MRGLLIVMVPGGQMRPEARAGLEIRIKKKLEDAGLSHHVLVLDSDMSCLVLGPEQHERLRSQRGGLDEEDHDPEPPDRAA